MSDMGGLPSEYHHDGGVPFPGPDAVGLAVSTLERPNDTAQSAADRARQSTAAAVDPTGVALVTHDHERLCIDCHWCRDRDQPTPPAFLLCYRPIITAANNGTAPCCVTARSGYYGHLACGIDGLWFEDAIERTGETAWSQAAAGGRLSAP